MHPIWIVLIILAGLLAIAGLAFLLGDIFFRIAIKPVRDRKRTIRDWFAETPEAQWYAAQLREGVEIHAQDGLMLYGELFFAPQPSQNWAILAHGYGGIGAHMSYHARFFLEHGYNVLLPDARGHGRSQGNYIGMGWPERLDYLRWIGMLNDRFQPRNIVLLGVSMGGATVMMASGEALPDNLRAIIEDCGYSSVYDQLAYRLKKDFHLPRFPVMACAGLVTRLRAGYRFKEASAVEQVRKSKTPILFIHGDEDDYVPFCMLDCVYDAAGCEKEKYVVPGAKHANAATVGGPDYIERVMAFVGRYAK